MSGPPLSAFKLTYDILLHMISLYSCASEAVPLIATCRVLYHEGVKIALKKPVVIFDATELASFLKFLHAENSSRCRYLKELDIWGFHAEPELVQELLKILPLLVNIETLQLASAEQFLASDPALPMAFAALTSLRHVDVCGASDATCAFLSSLNSPLVSATVDFITDHDDDSTDLWDRLTVDQWPIYHPTALLGNLSSTLEELRCVSWSTTPVAIRSDRVYTNMRKLSIEVHNLHLRIDPFICAFPNLTDLNVHTDNFYDPIYETDLEAMRTSHETNVRQQLTSCGTWTRLEHFTGRLSDLYAIGLTCRIGRITIVDDVGDELRMGMLATVLRYARPLHLKLQGIACTMLEGSEPSFISTLRSEGASALLNLDVCIYFGEEDRDRDLTVVVVRVLFYSLPATTTEINDSFRGCRTTWCRR